MKNVPWSKEEEQILIDWYGKKDSKEIHKMLPKRNPGTIIKKVQSIRRKSGQIERFVVNHSLNENFFKDIENSARWAGFIAADGHITDRGSVMIGLASKDRCILEAFKEDIEYTGDIKTKQHSCFGTGKIYYQSNLLLSRQRLAEDLAVNFNLYSGKKFDRLVPPVLNDYDALSFICGYIEGDGSIGFTNNKGHIYPFIEIAGNIEFLSWIKTYFDKWCEYTGPLKNIYKTKGTSIILMSGSRAKIVLKILVEHSKKLKFRLERKWSQFDYLLDKSI